jgi:acyl-CoA synthetase (AMP-forming)/AMP-acid ligase II/ankyrin repeat protein
MAEASSNWLDKPAIQWSSSADRSTDDSDEYWDKEGILPSTQSTSGPYTITRISYRDLVSLTTEIVKRLRLLLLLSSTGETTTGIPVVVAIPEGPFLPLAILAVHLLSQTSDGSTYAILVPMEPGEGKERLVHMMSDARPALVLAATSGKGDWTKLEEVIEQAADRGEQGDSLQDHEGRRVLQSSQPPQLVDFVNLIREIRKEQDDEESSAPDPHESITDNVNAFWNLVAAQEATPSDAHCPSRISHICYTSGTTGVPKGCVSSRAALRHYLTVKNEAHGIDNSSSNSAVVLLCSALSFDPCLSDILATLQAQAILVITPRKRLLQQLADVIQEHQVTHVLCTPTLWSMVSTSADIVPSLQVVALGGEPIPKRIVRDWANRVRLFATYGVTEACVYQTMGQVKFEEQGGDCVSTNKGGQFVGSTFRGLHVGIVKEGDGYIFSMELGTVGEIVLAGAQVDDCSGYWNRKDLVENPFVYVDGRHFYKTGDKGYIDEDGNLYILGRIQGQDGMVKVNGVRIELGEIEAALVDDTRNHQDEPSTVDACLAVARPSDPNDSESPKQIYAFCVLGQTCSTELGLECNDKINGIVISGGPLWILLRMRCEAMTRAGSMPSVFVLINRIPLSPTGKTDRRKLPQLSECIALDTLNGSSDDVLLKDYGNSGTMVADVIVDVLNLQQCQQTMLTTSSSFAMLGGDSLAATRVVRTLYATHNGVHNSRFLGGSFGALDGAFSVANLLQAHTLGDYVDWLDTSGVCGSEPHNEDRIVPSQMKASSTPTMGEANKLEFLQYDALLEATTVGYTAVAVGLLNVGVDPNIGSHGGRLSKVSSRNERKKTFKSNPLHVACNKGNPQMVRKLLATGCKFNSPDASGNFPLHMAASGTTEAATAIGVEQDDVNRTECVKMIIDAGAPLSMKDSNKQLVLHSAARAGHCRVLRYLLSQWEAAIENGSIKLKNIDTKNKAGKFDWMDRWYRTPVHWAVLNGRVGALDILLKAGFSAAPPTPSHKAKKQTSVEVETPLAICDRLYNDVDPKWETIRRLLLKSLDEASALKM